MLIRRPPGFRGLSRRPAKAATPTRKHCGAAPLLAPPRGSLSQHTFTSLWRPVRRRGRRRAIRRPRRRLVFVLTVPAIVAIVAAVVPPVGRRAVRVLDVL